MVWAVCRHLLRDAHDAADAFQATFLVLVRKAGSVRVEESLGNWLYGVACRVALRLRSDVVRRRNVETLAAQAGIEACAEGSGFDELRPILHDELSKLPAKYRAPVVLCYLEGLTHSQASKRLGWPLGTVKGRLARARDVLRMRLSRRGLALSLPLLVAALKPKTAAAALDSAVRSRAFDEVCRQAARTRMPAPSWGGGLPVSYHGAAVHGMLCAGGKFAAAVLATTFVLFAAGLSRSDAEGASKPVAAGGERTNIAEDGPSVSAAPPAKDAAPQSTLAASTVSVQVERSRIEDDYATERARCGRDPKAHLRLALWCEQHGLDAQRLKHLAIAVLTDPSNSTARGLMGLVFDEGRWRTADAVPERLRSDQAQATLLAEYEKRRASTPKTAEGQWKLGLWCEEHGLKAEAYAHFTLVTQLDPSREAAWRRVGCRSMGGRWLTEEQIASERARLDAQARADRHWQPLLEKWRAWLADRDQERRTKAERHLTTVSDPLAARSVWWVFAEGGEAKQAIAVQLFGQMDGSDASRALATLAVVSPWGNIRRSATETLLHRDPREFIGSLIQRMRNPVKFEVRPVGGPGAPGVLFVEGQKFNVGRLYAPPPLPVLPVGGSGSFELDMLGWVVAWVNIPGFLPINPVTFALATELSGWGAPRPEVVTSVLGPNSGLQVAPWEGVALRLPPALRPVTATRISSDGIPQVAIPVGRMVSEISKTAAMAQKQLEQDIKAIDEYNAQLEKTSEPIVRVLAHFTNERIRGYRDDWQKWWDNAQGYAYAPRNERPKPTVVENVALAYKPQRVDGFIFDDQAGYIPEPRVRTSCFGAGTLVRTKLGSRAIESLEVGDQVLAQDPVTGALSFQPVIAVIHNRPSPTLRISLGAESIVATGIHRFWKAGEGWMMARELKPGDVLRTYEGLVRVERIEPVATQPVFNLEVARAASFFVGKAGALVHDNSLVEPVEQPFDAVSKQVEKGAEGD
jgi:RNA polymerase sigma factor (sigma-70 family)